jgi:8-oxo-dGTP pyrophosphatase MutT (NUDIX family)
MSLLFYEINNFNGAIVDSASLPEKLEDFKDQLRNTIVYLREERRKTLWLTLPIDRVAFVPAAVEEGFMYHHAGETSLQLVLKLQPEAFVPPFATHYIGAGGVILDGRNRLLVIQERFHTKRHYKLPGGALDRGEHIADAVVREVLEETGIRTEFQYLSCFRHWHGYRFGKSDIYFVCRLKPLTFELTPDPVEIAEALWMPLEEYLNHPDTHPFNRKIVRTTLKGKGMTADEIPGYGTPESHEMFFL